MSTSLQYELIVRQQPLQARVCCTDKLDRRPIDPTPIIQFRSVTSAKGPRDTVSFLENPNYFMFASLVSPDEDVAVQYLDGGKTRALNGSAVSTLWHLQDPQNEKYTGFFAFPELSVKIVGRFRLKFTLFEMKDAYVHHCKSILSDTFWVYTPNKFPGMQASTDLSCALADQGLRIRLRYDTRLRQKGTKRGLDRKIQSGQGNNKRGKIAAMVDLSVPDPNSWVVIDPVLAIPHVFYSPPPDDPVLSSPLQFPQLHGLQRPTSSDSHTHAHIAAHSPAEHWQAPPRSPPAQPRDDHVLNLLPQSNGNDEKRTSV